MVAVFVPVLSKANCSSQRPEGEGWDRLPLPTKKKKNKIKKVAQRFITLLAK